MTVMKVDGETVEFATVDTDLRITSAPGHSSTRDKGIAQQAHDVIMTSDRRRCDVMSHRR